MFPDPKEDFPILNNTTYLNTARSGLLSKSLKKWRSEHDEWFLNEGSEYRKNQEDFLLGVRHTVSSLFDSISNYTVLVPNFSIGLGLFLDRIPKDMKVLMVEDDYPSINLGVEARNFKSCYVQLSEKIEEDIYNKVKSEAPDMLAISWVHYKTGLQIDKGFFKKLKSDFPSLFIVVDGTQYCGVGPVHFDRSGIDLLGASGYKWLLAGYGNGFMLYNERAGRLINSQKGNDISLSHNQIENELQLYNQPGHLDTLNFGSLQIALREIRYRGEPSVYKYIGSFSKKAKAKFAERGLLDEITLRRPMHSTIFSLSGNQKLHQKLLDNNIICSLWEDKIRVSFHYYNTEEDIDRLCSFL